MRNILFILILFSFNASATNRYYSSSTGNDITGDGTIGNPWASIAKLNNLFSSYSAGDSILFKRGDTFYGAIVVGKSGTSGNPIIISNYGTGAAPIITGYTDIASWTNIGGNLWESATITIASNFQRIGIVVINGVNANPGRWPNAGYAKFESSVGNSSITDNELTGSPNYSGGEVVIRKLHWYMSRDSITTHSGSTINYIGTGAYNSTNGYGYFVRSHINTLDTANEWYFNRTTKKLTIYSASSPINVKVTTVDTLLSTNSRNYITVDGLNFQGANYRAISGGSFGNGNYIKIQNCTINNVGKDGIYLTVAKNCTASNNTITNCNDNGIMFASVGGFSDDITVRENNLKNIGLVPGAGTLNNYKGITVFGHRANIVRNNIDSTGYNGISLYYNDSKADSNYVQHYLCVLDDGGGIYTWRGTGGTEYTGKKIRDNIVRNGVGAGAGTLDGISQSQAIYLDDWTAFTDVVRNTVEAGTTGIYLHNCSDIRVDSNIIFGPSSNGIYLYNDDAAKLVRNIVFTNNTVYVRSYATLFINPFSVHRNDIDSFFSNIDYNKYLRTDTVAGRIIRATWKNGTLTGADYTLSSWVSNYGYDTHSVMPSFNHNYVSLYLNTTPSPLTVNLPAIFKLIELNTNYRTVTIAPYSYKLLQYLMEKSGDVHEIFGYEIIPSTP